MKVWVVLFTTVIALLIYSLVCSRMMDHVMMGLVDKKLKKGEDKDKAYREALVELYLIVLLWIIGGTVLVVLGFQEL